MFIVADRVQETTNSPGTGTATLLGAVSGYQSFSTGIGINNTTYYVIADQLGTNWEVGLGALNSTGTVLTRTTVYSSSNGGSTVNFATGTQYVWCDYPSSKAVIQGTAVNFSSIGATTAGTGAFTTLSASSTVSGAGFSNYFASPPTIGNTTPNAGTFTTITGTLDASISGLTVGKGGGAVSTNTAVGYGAIGSSNSGGYHSAFGDIVLYQNTSGVANSAFGYASLFFNTTGGTNSGFGNQTLYANTTGSNNVAVGPQALTSNTTASYNTAVGYQAGYSNTTGTNNNTFGSAAGYAITTGSNNLALGSSSATNLTTGSNNIYVGYSFASSASVAGEVVIAFGATGKGGGTSYIQGSAYQTTNSTLWSITSDERLKKNIVDNTDGLNKITAIQVRNFEYRTANEVTELPSQNAIDIKGVQLGAIAQELQVILPDCVKTESTGVMSVDASNLTWYLINAVKELNAKVTALESQLGTK